MAALLSSLSSLDSWLAAEPFCAATPCRWWSKGSLYPVMETSRTCCMLHSQPQLLTVVLSHPRAYCWSSAHHA